ncbi:hypothetical protein AVEN_130700-1 [Araneus ventricosus]|uniref:Uncharacterized protein n=1 Tax=Araneus ventricosus TaxID=182803 RepID=A0A4Y2TVS2_ARAVE|nr:hypothetical protein AVEN_44402-1 [Araneus ventricosus]GBO04723.1 hypothetical protein AVEN_130700-1 [Araneus ventricosus]
MVSLQRRRDYRLLWKEDGFTIKNYIQQDQLCVSVLRQQRNAGLFWTSYDITWTRQKWVSVIFTNESRFTLESDPGRVLIWREQVTRYHQSNIVERFSYRDGEIMVWAGISSVRHTDFHELHVGNPTADALRERKSPIHMSEHMLVLLVKNSSSSMIMLDLAELRLVRDILRIKLQQEAGVTAIRRLNIFLPDSLTTLVPGEVEKWETDWAAHPSECPTEEQISLEDGGGITSGTRIYTDDSKAEKGVVAAFCVWSE